MHAQLGKQGDQLRVGALVEHQKAGVHAVGARPLRRVQRDIHRVRVAAKVAAGLQQRDRRMRLQAVRGGQTSNAGADNCDFHKKRDIVR